MARFDPVDLPWRILRLPQDARGYPVPRFVQYVLEGKRVPREHPGSSPDFRIMDFDHWVRCIGGKEQRGPKVCWICGEPLGVHLTFPIGPMCAINRVTAEPPSHLECAVFAAKVCPFLSNPAAKRNERELPEHVAVAGLQIKRNPGVTCLWTTRSYHVFKSNGQNGSGDGYLINIGPPEHAAWMAEGRDATYAEVCHALDTGLPRLRELAKKQGGRAQYALNQQIGDFLRMECLPKRAELVAS